METISISKAEYEMFLSFKNQFDFSKKAKIEDKRTPLNMKISEKSLKEIWDNEKDDKTWIRYLEND